MQWVLTGQGLLGLSLSGSVSWRQSYKDFEGSAPNSLFLLSPIIFVYKFSGHEVFQECVHPIIAERHLMKDVSLYKLIYKCNKILIRFFHEICQADSKIHLE